jgi:Protein of unknown function (DUF3293)
MTVPEGLLEAYRRTAFTADTPTGRLSLRVGQHCPELDHLLHDRGVSAWAFVTAFNPGSRRLPDNENEARQRRLKAAVASLGLSSYPGEGVADNGEWPPEHSLLILGLTRVDAARLGRDHGQVAVLYGELGRKSELLLCADG